MSSNSIPPIPQVKISYSNPVPFGERVRVTCSGDAVKYIQEIMGDEIGYRELAYAIYLNRANQVLGYFLVSVGGLTGTVIDIRTILQGALLSCAGSIILFHNHPSGNLQASEADKRVTSELSAAAKIMQIPLLDHIIVTKEHFFSFADEGLI